MGDFKSHGVTVCTPRQQQQLQQQLQQEVEEKADVGINMSAHFAISRTAASRVHPTWFFFGGAKPRGIIAARILLLEKLAVAENWRGVIMGCLQQYRKRWGFVQMATSRTAWPHALHGKQQQQQQREKSRRDQV